MAGGGRGGAVDAAAGGDRAAVPDAVEPGAVNGLGFETAHITTFMAMPADAAGFSGMAVSEDTGNAPTSVATITYEPVLERIRQVPGVESAALATSPPLSGMDLHSSFDILGQPKIPRTSRQRV